MSAMSPITPPHCQRHGQRRPVRAGVGRAADHPGGHPEYDPAAMAAMYGQLGTRSSVPDRRAPQGSTAR